MKPALLVVEGRTDKQFLRAYIEWLRLRASGVDIVGLGGKAELAKEGKREIISALRRERNALIIFDANSDPEQARADIAKTTDEIRDELGGVDIPVFLFPDNKGEGELEDLLQDIALAEHARIFECFDEYVRCLTGGPNGYSLAAKKIGKTRFYAYTHTLNIENRSFAGANQHYWDFKHPALAPLRDFLRQNLGGQ